MHTRAVSGLSTSRLSETVDHHGISRIDWWISAVSHRQRSFEKIFHDQLAYVSCTISYGKWRCFQRAVSVYCCSHCHICPASSSHFLSNMLRFVPAALSALFVTAQGPWAVEARSASLDSQVRNVMQCNAMLLTCDDDLTHFAIDYSFFQQIIIISINVISLLLISIKSDPTCLELPMRIRQRRWSTERQFSSRLPVGTSLLLVPPCMAIILRPRTPQRSTPRVEVSSSTKTMDSVGAC